MNDDMYKTKLQNIINYHNIEITNLNDIIIRLKTANDTLRKEIYSLKQTIPSDKEYCIMNQQQIDNFMKKLKVILNDINVGCDFFKVINENNAIITGKTIHDILLNKEISEVNLDIFVLDSEYIKSYNSNKISDLEYSLYDVCDKLYLDDKSILINPLYKFNQIIKQFSNQNQSLIINLFIVDTTDIFNYINSISNFTVFTDGITVKFAKN